MLFCVYTCIYSEDRIFIILQSIQCNNNDNNNNNDSNNHNVHKNNSFLVFYILFYYVFGFICLFQSTSACINYFSKKR